MNGNALSSIAPEVGQCQALRYLHLQTNRVRDVPREITALEVRPYPKLQITIALQDI